MGEILSMKNIFAHPLFLFGLFLRLGLVFSITPDLPQHWYVPFLDATMFEIDPWKAWQDQQGDLMAFPYGHIMWIIFWPLSALFKITDLSLFHAHGLTLMMADGGMLAILTKMFPHQKNKLLITYWLSPIIIVATYVLGHNDLIPALLLTICLFFIKRLRLLEAALICMAAISAKLSMILALPLVFIYFIRNKSLWKFTGDFFWGNMIGVFLFLLPYSLSSAAMNMLFNTPEMDKIYQFVFFLSANTQIYFAPLMYFLFLYATWRIKRINFELFYFILGIVFFAIVLMTPSSLGWFIWAMPVLSVYQASSNIVTMILMGIFSLLYIFGILFSLELPWTLTAIAKIASLVHTAMVATGIILILKILKEKIRENDYFRFSRKPFAIAIAGDSGAGKDTLSHALTGLFGNHSVTTLSGDNYHLWDRKRPIWKVMNHLNPMANDLEQFTDDLISLIDGKSIRLCHYDHCHGKKARPVTVKSNDIIIVSGLHAFSSPLLRQVCDINIFLDMDESLRKYFKIKRDTRIRGHSKQKALMSINGRIKDGQKFVRPQIDHAHLIFSLRPVTTLPPLDDEKALLHLQLVSKSRIMSNEMKLICTLIGLCGLLVTADNNAIDLELTIEGDCTSEDIAMAAETVCPKILSFLDTTPEWQGGVTGIMQLITLSHLNTILNKRFV